MDSPSYFDKTDFKHPFFTTINEKLISRIHKEVKKQNSVSGVWSDEENLTYAQFIQDHPYEFQTAEKRRRFKVFERMAMNLPNRTAIQCRSHNQKMVKLSGSILSVPQYIKRRLSPRGKKLQAPIEIKEEEKQKQRTRNTERLTMPISTIYQVQSSKQLIHQKRFELPLKLCIEIKSQNIEEYC